MTVLNNHEHAGVGAYNPVAKGVHIAHKVVLLVVVVHMCVCVCLCVSVCVSVWW